VRLFQVFLLRWCWYVIGFRVGSYRAWSAERDRPDGIQGGGGGKPQQYGRDGGGHNARDGYMNQAHQPRQWDNRGGYRPFIPGGMGSVLV